MIIRTLETTPRGATHWSTRDMAKALGLSRMADQSDLARLWPAAASQRDVQAVEGPVARGEGPRHRGVVSESARSTRPSSASTKNRRFKRWIARSRCCRCGPARWSAERTTTNGMARPRLFAALNAKTSEVITQFHHRHRSAQFREFLDLIEAQVPRRPRCAHHHGQLRHAQNAAHSELVCQTSTLSRPLHAHVWIVVEPRRAVVCRADEETDSAAAPIRSVPQLKAAIQEFIDAHQERSQAVRVDQDAPTKSWRASPDSRSAPSDLQAAQLVSRTTGTGH